MKLRNKLFLCLLAAAPLAAQANIVAAYTPIWDGAVHNGGVVPYKILIDNNGPDAGGVVRVTSGDNSLTYPLELPKGTSKSFLIYPHIGNEYSDLNLTISTNRGSQSMMLTPPETNFYQTGQSIGMISDDPGRLRLLRTDPSQQDPIGRPDEAIVSDSYCRPEDAPDRTVGYSPLDALVLGEGAERISDAAVAAIKNWVLAGGRLIFVGGAQTPLLNDPRWADILPVKDARGIQVRTVAWLKNFGPAPSGPYSFASVSVIQPAVASVSENRPVKVHRTVGLGRVIFLAVNPFEEPLRTWEGRKDMILQIASQGEEFSQQFYSDMAGVLDEPNYTDYSGYGAFGAAESSSSNPFNVTLPHPVTLLMVLAAYWVLVVPVLFTVLGKIGRRELAWVIAPVVSVGFAGIFFSFAGSLYGSSTARSTQGVLITDSSQESAYFIGRQQLFLPDAARYNLGLQGVETLHSIALNYGMNQGRASSSAFQGHLMDVGEIQGVQVPVGSLSFREYGLRQRVEMAGQIKGELKATIKDKLLHVKGTITNSSQLELSSVEVISESFSLGQLGGLYPGEKKAVDVKIPLGDQNPAAVRVYLRGTVDGSLPIGAKLGQPVNRGPGITLMCSMGDLTVGRGD